MGDDHHNTTGDNKLRTAYEDDDEKGTVYELREEVERLKEEIRSLQSRLKSDDEVRGFDVSSKRSMNQEILNGNNHIGAEDTNEIQFNNHSDPHPQSIGNIDILPITADLTTNQISRYSRQLLLSDGFGVEGQRKLLSSKVLVVGAGGIGSSLLLYLAASGVGHVTIVDYDAVERSNLHRQIIHRDRDAVGGGVVRSDTDTKKKNKAQSAKEAMLRLNPTVSITALDVCLDSTNIIMLVHRHDVVVDASDNPATRYLINDACILCNVPLVSGSAMGTEGQLTVYNYNPSRDNNNTNQGGGCNKSACYRCLYPNPNPMEGCKSCSDNGVLGPVPGLIGVLQAVEVIKIITGIG